MGSLKKFAQWLSGDGSRKKNETSPLTKLKIFNKRLARQIQKMEIQEKRARKKAVQARTEGDIPGSRMHMKSSLQFRKWSNSTENFRVKMEGVQYKLEQAKAMGEFASVAQDIASALKGLQATVKMPEISELIKQMDMGFEGFDAMMESTVEQLEVSEDGSSTAVSDNEVDDALAEVDAELSITTGQALPSVPGTTTLEIDQLEDEIEKLKSSRN